MHICASLLHPVCFQWRQWRARWMHFSGNGPGAAPAAVDRQSTQTQLTAYAAALLIVKLLCTAHWHGHGSPREKDVDSIINPRKIAPYIGLHCRVGLTMHQYIHPAIPFSSSLHPCLPVHFGHFTENTRKSGACFLRAAGHQPHVHSMSSDNNTTSPRL